MNLSRKILLIFIFTVAPCFVQGFAQASMNTPQCKAFQDYIQGAGDPTNGLQTDGLVVMKDGAIRYEYYDKYYSSTTPHCLWSVSKSITSALLGTAVLDNKISLDEPLNRYFPASSRKTSGPNEPLYNNIKISDLLEMGSGLKWIEDYESTVQTSSVISMLYLKGRGNMAEFALNSSMRPEGPGGIWNYSSGDTNILMGVLKKIYGSQYDALPWHNVFNPIGMRGVVFEKDDSGAYVGAAYVHSTPREMTKFGQLYMGDGVWQGKRLLPEGWVKMSRTVSNALLAKGTSTDEIISEGVYGRGFWLNQRVRDLPLPFPNSPEDMFFAAGHFGQLIIMIPSRGLILTRTGHDNEYWSKIDPMVSKALACFTD